jgi:hypothetical protein
LYNTEKKKDLDRRGFQLPLPHPQYDTLWAGFKRGFFKISKMKRPFSIPTGVAKAGGRSPGSVMKLEGPKSTE